MKKYIVLIWLTALIAVFAVTGCAREPAEPLQAERDLSDIDTESVGQEVITGDIVWEITEVEDLGNLLTYEGAAGYLEPELGKFVGITFSIQNTGNDPKVIYDLTAIDERGRSYSICLAAIAFFSPEQACVLQDILPGVENTYSATFDVEVDVNRLVLQVTDLEMPPREVAYIDLGI